MELTEEIQWTKKPEKSIVKIRKLATCLRRGVINSSPQSLDERIGMIGAGDSANRTDDVKGLNFSQVSIYPDACLILIGLDLSDFRHAEVKGVATPA